MNHNDIHELARRRAAELRDEALDRFFAGVLRALKAVFARAAAPAFPQRLEA